MRKWEEIDSPNSCLNRAYEGELLFVLRGKDKTAPMVIRFWVESRISCGLNTRTDPKIIDALKLAESMENERDALLATIKA